MSGYTLEIPAFRGGHAFISAKALEFDPAKTLLHQAYEKQTGVIGTYVRSHGMGVINHKFPVGERIALNIYSYPFTENVALVSACARSYPVADEMLAEFTRIMQAKEADVPRETMNLARDMESRAFKRAEGMLAEMQRRPAS